MGEIIKSLNPVNIDFSKKYDILNLFNPIKKYFRKIEKEEIFIGNIIEILNDQKNIIDRDNITLEIEINRIKEIIGQLQNEYNNGNILKKEICFLIEQSKDNNNETMVKYYTQNCEALLDNKMFDIKQMIIVKQQSMMALQIIIRNNKEIMRNIDRVKNITISALNTAVIVAKTIYNQKIILNKINNIEIGIGKIDKSIATNLDKMEVTQISSKDEAQFLLKKTFENAIEIFENVDSENKKSFPENEKKIKELKMEE